MASATGSADSSSARDDERGGSPLSPEREGEEYCWVGPGTLVLLPAVSFRAELREGVSIGDELLEYFYLRARNEGEAFTFAEKAAVALGGELEDVEEEEFPDEGGFYLFNFEERRASAVLALLGSSLFHRELHRGRRRRRRRGA